MTDDVHAGEPIEIHSCDDVLSHVFEFLDHETEDSRRAVIAGTWTVIMASPSVAGMGPP